MVSASKGTLLQLYYCYFIIIIIIIIGWLEYILNLCTLLVM